MRIVTLVILAMVLTGCKHLSDGHDGIDGAGLAAVLRKQFNNDR